jgi:hypothetical protein
MSLHLKYLFLFCMVAVIISCGSRKNIYLQVTEANEKGITGSDFYKMVASWKWKERDSLAIKQILAGNIPSFLKKFVPVQSEITDSAGHKHRAVFYALPDYLSIGTNEDWARVPLTPMAAQKIADQWNCMLPTRKMVDLIYQQAKVKLEPVPMSAFRDSSVTFWQHHLIIEGQRKGRTGLVAGIKKDVVQPDDGLSDVGRRSTSGERPTSGANRVAIYGWHLLNGKPIQPLYAGHINWYVDYSHGIRFISNQMKVDGKLMSFAEVMQHPVYRLLLCDGAECSFQRY